MRRQRRSTAGRATASAAWRSVECGRSGGAANRRLEPTRETARGALARRRSAGATALTPEAARRPATRAHVRRQVARPPAADPRRRTSTRSPPPGTPQRRRQPAAGTTVADLTGARVHYDGGADPVPPTLADPQAHRRASAWCAGRPRHGLAAPGRNLTPSGGVKVPSVRPAAREPR